MTRKDAEEYRCQERSASVEKTCERARPWPADAPASRTRKTALFWPCFPPGVNTGALGENAITST